MFVDNVQLGNAYVRSFDKLLLDSPQNHLGKFQTPSGRNIQVVLDAGLSPSLRVVTTLSFFILTTYFSQKATLSNGFEHDTNPLNHLSNLKLNITQDAETA